MDLSYLAWTNMYGDLIGELEADHFIGWAPRHIDEVPLFDRLLDELLIRYPSRLY